MPTEIERESGAFSIEKLTIDDLSAADVDEAIRALSRGMRDNPLHIAAFGSDPRRRVRRLEKQFDRVFSAMGIDALVARDEAGRIVGVLGMAPPGACIGTMTGGQKLRLMPMMLPMGLGLPVE